MNFKKWLLIEAGRSSKITVEPGLKVPIEVKGSDISKWVENEKEIVDLVSIGIRGYFQRIDPKGWRFAKERYDFHINEVRETSDGVIFEIVMSIHHDKEGNPEILPQDDPMYKFYPDGKTGKVFYKTPKDAIESIPHDERYGYRGMAWEEWQSIKRTGAIKSLGSHNIGQENYTMFGYDPATAEAYAHGFAPIQYMVGYRKPGIVIAVPKEFLRTHQDDPENIPTNELGLYGPLKKEHIVHAWILTITSSKKSAKFSLIYPWKASWDVNAYKDPRMGIFELDTKKILIGSGSFIAGTNYAIRQLF